MSDLISREYMKSLGGACIAQRLKNGDLCPIISIDLLPSVQPRKGEWIYSEGLGYGNPYGHYECSLCGDGYGYKTNFCPNCGCRMEEGDSE